MGASYTAKPAVVTVPDVPDDWDIDWSFPGPPFPPGYDPVYSLNISAPASMVPGSEVPNCSVTLKDNVTFTTSDPPEAIVYSATLQSSRASVGLMVSGAEDYLSIVSQDYSASGDFFGNTINFEFNVSAANDGDFIVLAVSSSPFGFSLTDTANIEIIVPPVITFTIETVFDYSYPAGLPYDGSFILSTGVKSAGAGVPPYAWCSYSHSEPGARVVDSEAYDSYPALGTYIEALNGDPWELGTVVAKSHRVEAVDGNIVDGTWSCGINYNLSSTTSGSYTTTLKVYLDGELSTTKVKSDSLSASAQNPEWNDITVFWTINGDTGEVTTL